MRAPEIPDSGVHVIKASATVTLSSIVDVKSVWRYYKLQLSNLTKPDKPIKNPPEGWTTTEPSYTDGSTNNLYFCDLTVFCDDTFVYSDVSLSSSYEAAKAAYNKAIAADKKAQNAKDTVNNMEIGGRNLLTNTGDKFQPSGGWSQSGSTWVPEGYYEYWYYEIPKTDPYYETKVGDVVTISFDAEVYNPDGSNDGWLNLYDSNLHASVSIGAGNITFPPNSIPKSTLVKVRGSATRTLVSKQNTGDIRGIEFYCGYGSGRYFKISRLKIERGNKATDWSPAPEDLASADDVTKLTTRVTNAETSIDKNKEAITLRATKTEVTEAVDTGVQTSKTYTDTELTQTSEEIRFDFNKSITSTSNDLQSRMDDNDIATNQKLSEINKYIRFVDGNIILGETGNKLMLTIQNNRVSFTQSGVEVAYFSDNKLHINKAEVLTSMKIGNYELAPRTDGGLALRKWKQQ